MVVGDQPHAPAALPQGKSVPIVWEARWDSGPVWRGAENLDSAVGWGTALQAGRWQVRFPMVSLEFFIDVILPATLWPWGELNLYQKWKPGIFPGG